MSDITTILANARAHEMRMLEGSRAVLDDWGGEAQDWMQANAPWQDRPDDERPQGLPHARELLAYVPDHPPDLRDGGQGHLIQGAEYGWALELANAGQYGILPETVATLGPQLLAELQQDVWR